MANLRILSCLAVVVLACTLPTTSAHGYWRRVLLALQQGENGNQPIIIIPGNSNSSGSNDSFSDPNEIIPKIQTTNLNNENIKGQNPQVIVLGDVAPTRVTPERIQQINNGVSTILGGVGSGSLENILRGSFMFTRNENVRTVANNVLDSIFGSRRRTQQ